MDRRRNRRRGHSHSHQEVPPQLLSPESTPKSSSLINGLCNFLVLISLIGLIYLMLDYHCTHCKVKFDADSILDITKNINDIAKNLSTIKDDYYDLELKISKLSQDLPKLEGQISILEALANTIENSHILWNPNNRLPVRNLDVYLNKKFDVATRNASSKTCPIQNSIY